MWLSVVAVAIVAALLAVSLPNVLCSLSQSPISNTMSDAGACKPCKAAEGEVAGSTAAMETPSRPQTPVVASKAAAPVPAESDGPAAAGAAGPGAGSAAGDGVYSTEELLSLVDTDLMGVLMSYGIHVYVPQFIVEREPLSAAPNFSPLAFPTPPPPFPRLFSPPLATRHCGRCWIPPCPRRRRRSSGSPTTRRSRRSLPPFQSRPPLPLPMRGLAQARLHRPPRRVQARKRRRTLRTNAGYEVRPGSPCASCPPSLALPPLPPISFA